MPEETAGVRDSKALAAAVLEPLEVVEVAAVRDRLDPLRAEVAQLLRDRVGDGDDGVGALRDQASDESLALLLHPHGEPIDAPVGVRGHRVAQIGDPWDAGRLLDRSPDQVDGGRRRRRDHDVDLLLLDDPPGGRDRSQAPADELVWEQQATREERGLPQEALRTLQALQLLGRQLGARPEVARAVHLRVGRDVQLVVARKPLGIVRREHVRLDPEVGQVSRQLQGSSDPTAAGRGEVHRHEQHSHRGER